MHISFPIRVSRTIIFSFLACHVGCSFFMFKKLSTVLALGLAFLNVASARYEKVVDVTPYLVASSSDKSKVLTLKPGVFYNIPTTTPTATYYVVVQCPKSKSTKVPKAFSTTFNAPGNDAGTRIYINDISEENVNFVENTYYYNWGLITCVGGVLGSSYY